MIIGIPKEIKSGENRVAITPAGVKALVDIGHKVLVETTAGQGSRISDNDYSAAGAEIMKTSKEVFDRVSLIIKVKELLPAEYDLVRERQTVFTYLHLAADQELTKLLVNKKVVSIAYETVQLDNGYLPLLVPMSEIAGRMSVQIGARFLEKSQGGAGILLGGVPGVAPAEVVIIGGGIVGTNAAKMAIGMGSSVTIIDKNAERMRYLDDIFDGRAKTIMANDHNIHFAAKNADLLIGAVLIPGAKAPRLVKEATVKEMRSGSVIVDVAIDQGGSIETIDEITTHNRPTYEKHGVIHYSVANIPSAVAVTSTSALTNVSLPYVVEIANKGWKKAVSENLALARGVNTLEGYITHQAIADAHSLPYTALNELL